MIFKNIVIPGSMFMAKYKEEEGYSIGIENYRLTKNYKTLELALNQIGYGVEKNKEDEEELVKVGEVDFDLIGRIIHTMIAIQQENMITELENIFKKENEQENN